MAKGPEPLVSTWAPGVSFGVAVDCHRPRDHQMAPQDAAASGMRRRRPFLPVQELRPLPASMPVALTVILLIK